MLRDSLAFSFIAVVLVSCNQAPNASPDLAVSQSPAASPTQNVTEPIATEPKTTEPQKTEPKEADAPKTAIEKRSTAAVKPEAEATKTEVEDKAPSGQLLFSCLTNDGKEILLRDAGSTINYRFGPPDGPPELQLGVPRDQASTWQWKGIGRSMSYSVNVPNGDTTYRVFWSADRIDQTVEAGVNVLINQKLAATVSCGDQIVQKLQGVDLKEPSL